MWKEKKVNLVQLCIHTSNGRFSPLIYYNLPAINKSMVACDKNSPVRIRFNLMHTYIYMESHFWHQLLAWGPRSRQRLQSHFCLVSWGMYIIFYHPIIREYFFFFPFVSINTIGARAVHHIGPLQLKQVQTRSVYRKAFCGTLSDKALSVGIKAKSTDIYIYTVYIH